MAVYLFLSLRAKPFDSFAILPKAVLLPVLGGYQIDAKSVLFPGVPVS